MPASTPPLGDASPAPARLALRQVRVDHGLSMREAIRLDVIEEYAQALADGAVFPPVVVFRDEQGIHWLADGFHRLAAHQKAGQRALLAQVRRGSRREALLYAIGANTTHGLRRTNAEKQKAVMELLKDAEWGQWSDREIARQAGVSQPFVSKLRAQLSDNGDQIAAGDPLLERLVRRGESIYPMSLASRAAPPPEPVAPTGEEAAPGRADPVRRASLIAEIQALGRDKRWSTQLPWPASRSDGDPPASSLPLSQALWERLVRAAARRGVAAPELLASILAEWLRQHEPDC